MAEPRFPHPEAVTPSASPSDTSEEEDADAQRSSTSFQMREQIEKMKKQSQRSQRKEAKVTQQRPEEGEKEETEDQRGHPANGNGNGIEKGKGNDNDPEVEVSKEEEEGEEEEKQGSSGGLESDELTDVLREAQEGKNKRDKEEDLEDAAILDEPEEDKVGEERLERERALTEEEMKTLREEAQALKNSANASYRANRHEEAVEAYTKALDLCPMEFKEDRAIFYSNRAAAKMGQGLSSGALSDCSAALRLKPDYVRALARRGQLFEDANKPHEAMTDFQQILKLDPGHREANLAVQRLPSKISARDEEIKAEMFGNLKKLGNMVLNPFGMSTENFQFVQDPSTGSYSVNFKNS